jgi:adenylate kinase family enzyme
MERRALRAETRRGNPYISTVSLVGVPGSGKSTVGPLLAEQFGATYIGTGALLRTRMAQTDPMGVEIARFLGNGEIVPDDIVLKVLSSAISSVYTSHLVLDGVPRTAGQMRAIDAGSIPLRLDLVLFLDIPDHVAAERLAIRTFEAPRVDDQLLERRAEALSRGMNEVVELGDNWRILHRVSAIGARAEVRGRAMEVVAKECPEWVS